jgi:hypothetical protein
MHNDSVKPTFTEWIPIESSVLTSARYSYTHHLLHLKFRTGRLYEYTDIPAETFNELLRAESSGTYFNRHVRNCFPSNEITTAKAGS